MAGVCNVESEKLSLNTIDVTAPVEAGSPSGGSIPWVRLLTL